MVKVFLLAFLFTVSIIDSSRQANAQNDEGFIYGTITTVAGSVYKGQIRWGKEESFWNDIFNATKSSKSESTYSKYVPEKKKNDWWESLDGKILKIWEDDYASQTHQFTCRFGDIKSIAPRGDDHLVCEFKNGVKINLSGGSNDVGETIVINDYELGKIALKWQKILFVQFEATPKKLEERLGNPLYGQVKTKEDEFEGFIQWDKDERIGIDLIQGSSSMGKAEIPFYKIRTIENLGNTCDIELISGKVLNLGGTNDVNSQNRGIVVSIDGTGKIEIPWEVFRKLVLQSDPASSGPSYKSYPEPKRLEGIVKDLEGNEYRGLIVFDKDEKWDLELLEGVYKELKYVIPFRDISTIIPKNESYSYVLLKNKQKLILGKLQDVSSKNEGVVIIQKGRNEPTFLDWEQVDEIHFDQ